MTLSELKWEYEKARIAFCNWPNEDNRLKMLAAGNAYSIAKGEGELRKW